MKILVVVWVLITLVFGVLFVAHSRREKAARKAVSRLPSPLFIIAEVKSKSDVPPFTVAFRDVLQDTEYEFVLPLQVFTDMQVGIKGRLIVDDDEFLRFEPF